jgi:hypothetical protein
MYKFVLPAGNTFIGRLSLKGVFFVLCFAGIACLRFYYCAGIPVNTGDIPRHIYYGLYAGQMGLSAAGHGLAELNPSLSAIAWSSIPYNYPIMALLFFMAAVKLSPTIFFIKLALTIIEAFNSWLVFRYSRQRLLALLYWACPLSIWWVSHEGQFEPLQTLFALSALILLPKRRGLAFFLLAVAIQVKATAVLFIPLFLLDVLQKKPKDHLPSLVAFCVGLIPTIIAMFHYPVISQVLGTAGLLTYNPYYWNVLKTGMFGWNPPWLIAFDQCATYGMLLLLVFWAVKLRDNKGFLAPAGFIIFCKIAPICQFWYFTLQMSFLLPVQDKRKRLWLFALTPLLDISSLIQIISGPFGYTVGSYYDSVTVFLKHTI